MIKDDSTRTLIQVMIMAKSIIDAGKLDEFYSECAKCANNEALFVVGTDATRRFIAEFCDKYKIDPRGKKVQMNVPQELDLEKLSNITAKFPGTVTWSGVVEDNKLVVGYGSDRCTRGS